MALSEFGPPTIAAVYKDRWQVELSSMKQNLKIKTFAGSRANAV